MSCLPCFSKDEEDESPDQPEHKKKESSPHAAPPVDPSASNAKSFTFRELAVATRNFRQECLIGEGGFGRVFKGKLQSNGQIVAVKQLDRNGMQPNKEFLNEVIMLSLLQHPNLVNLIGYCADGDQRLLVYEYMEMGSLEDHLFGKDPEKKMMDWYKRMKIAAGAAQGLEFLHDKANPSIIYRDLKPSNILLDPNYEPKLSDYGLAKLGAGGGKINPTSRVMGTYGYSAPEYSSSGELTLKSDVYSFGVVLLELITGRRVIDTTRPNDEQNLVSWAQPIFRDPKRFPDLADPHLNKEFPVTGLNQAVGICAMCLQEEASVRPLIGDVVAALSFLAIPQSNAVPASTPTEQKSNGVPEAFSPPPEQKMHYANGNQNQPAQRDKDGSNHNDSSSRRSSDSEDEESNRESVDKKQSEAAKSYSNSTKGGHNSEGKTRSHSRGQSADNSDGESSCSDGGGAHDNGTKAVKDHGTAKKDANRSNSDSIDSSQSDAGNFSSQHGSSRGCSPTQRTGSRQRKMVVTFKEPSLSSRRNGSKNVEEESSSPQQDSSSSSSSESSSESEDERGTS